MVRCLGKHDSGLNNHNFLFYLLTDGSSEEHRYVSTLSREKKAFHSLISIKETMVISLPDLAADVEREQRSMFEISMDTRSQAKAIAAAASSSVVVDIREFRSSLPSLLHAAGFTIVPRTIQVRQAGVGVPRC